MKVSSYINIYDILLLLLMTSWLQIIKCKKEDIVFTYENKLLIMIDILKYHGKNIFIFFIVF